LISSERRATQLEIEKQALKKEEDPNSRERLTVIDKELAEIRERANALKAKWKKEKDLIARQRQLKEQLEQLKSKSKRRAQGNLQRVPNPVWPHPTNRGRTEEAHAQMEKPARCACSRKKWTKKTSPASSPSGRAFQSRRCSKAKSRSYHDGRAPAPARRWPGRSPWTRGQMPSAVRARG